MGWIESGGLREGKRTYNVPSCSPTDLNEQEILVIHVTLTRIVTMLLITRSVRQTRNSVIVVMAGTSLTGPTASDVSQVCSIRPKIKVTRQLN